TGAATTQSYTPSLHDALPIYANAGATIALTNSSITAGTVRTDAASGATPGGEIDSSGTSSIASAQVNNFGTLDVESGTLTLSSETEAHTAELKSRDPLAALTL